MRLTKLTWNMRHLVVCTPPPYSATTGMILNGHAARQMRWWYGSSSSRLNAAITIAAMASTIISDSQKKCVEREPVWPHPNMGNYLIQLPTTAYISRHILFHLSIRAMYLSVYLSFPSIYLSFYLSTYLSIYLPTYLSIYQYILSYPVYPVYPTILIYPYLSFSILIYANLSYIIYLIQSNPIYHDLFIYCISFFLCQYYLEGTWHPSPSRCNCYRLAECSSWSWRWASSLGSWGIWGKTALLMAREVWNSGKYMEILHMEIRLPAFLIGRCCFCFCSSLAAPLLQGVCVFCFVWIVSTPHPPPSPMLLLVLLLVILLLLVLLILLLLLLLGS